MADDDSGVCYIHGARYLDKVVEDGPVGADDEKSSLYRQHRRVRIRHVHIRREEQRIISIQNGVQRLEHLLVIRTYAAPRPT